MSNSQNDQALLITSDAVPVAAYQAIYHKLTGKVEKLTEKFNDVYLVTELDVLHLNRLIEQHVFQYGPKGTNCEITVSLHENESFKFNSFEKFSHFNFKGISQPTSVLNYQFDFYSVFPSEIPEAQEIVQRYKIVLRLDQDFLDEFDNLPSFIRFSVSGDNIVLTIEYTDYAVARALQGVVRDWVAGLTSCKSPKLAKAFSRFRFAWMQSIAPFVILLTAVGALLAAKKMTIVSLESLVKFFCVSAIIGAVATIGTRLVMIGLDSVVQKLTPVTHLMLTKGDQERKSARDSSANKNRAILAFLVFVVVAGVGINLFSAWIYNSIIASGK